MWYRSRKREDFGWGSWVAGAVSIQTIPGYDYQFTTVDPFIEPFKPGLFRRKRALFINDTPHNEAYYVYWFEKDPGSEWMRVE